MSQSLTSFKYNRKKRKVDPLDVLPGRERFAIRQKTLRDEGGNSMIDRVRLKPMNGIDSLTFSSGRNIPPRHVRFKLHHNNVEKGGYPMWTINDEGGNFVARPPPLGGVIAAGVAAAVGGAGAAGGAVARGVLGRAANLASGVARNIPNAQSVASGISNTFNFLRNGVPSWLGQRPQQGGQIFQPRIPQQANGDPNQPLLAQPPLPPQLAAVAEEKGRSRSRSRSRSFGTLHFNEKENELNVLEAVREKAIREGVTRDEPFGYPWGRASARETSPERKSSGSKSQQSKNETDEVIRKLRLSLDQFKEGGNGKTSGGQAQLSSLNNSVPMLPDVNMQDTPTFATLELQQGAEYKTPSEMKAFYEPLQQQPPQNRRKLEYDDSLQSSVPMMQVGKEVEESPDFIGTPRVYNIPQTPASTRNLKGREPYMPLGGAAHAVVPSFASNSDPMFMTQGDNVQGVEVVEKWAQPRKLTGPGGGLPRGPRGDEKLIKENITQGVVLEKKLRGSRTPGKPTAEEAEREARGRERAQSRSRGSRSRSKRRQAEDQRKQQQEFMEKERNYTDAVARFVRTEGVTDQEVKDFKKKMETFFFY